MSNLTCEGRMKVTSMGPKRAGPLWMHFRQFLATVECRSVLVGKSMRLPKRCSQKSSTSMCVWLIFCIFDFSQNHSSDSKKGKWFCEHSKNPKIWYEFPIYRFKRPVCYIVSPPTYVKKFPLWGEGFLRLLRPSEGFLNFFGPKSGHQLTWARKRNFCNKNVRKMWREAAVYFSQFSIFLFF